MPNGYCGLGGDTQAKPPVRDQPGSLLPDWCSSGAPEALEGHFGSTFRYQEGGAAGIANELIKAGDGSRGVIFAWRDGSDIGHFFNAVNHGGNVKFLDGQAGGYVDLDWDHWEFMRTEGGAR
ncbi:toxin glutamine deamidase domain-containing protein [Streptomyces mirabilis]